MVAARSLCGFAGALGHVALGRALVAWRLPGNCRWECCWPPASPRSALLNIYSQPNTRVQASVWIYDHVPAGSVLTNEVWDDPLPIQPPPARVDAQGIEYTASGAIINPGEYQQVGLNLYDDDTPQKADNSAQSLASANVVVISSQRLLKLHPQAARPLPHDDPLL